MAEYIDRTQLEPDTEWSEYEDYYISYSQTQIENIEPADVIERSEIDKAIEEIKHLTIYHKTTQGSELVSRKAVLRTINKYLGE